MSKEKILKEPLEERTPYSTLPETGVKNVEITIKGKQGSHKSLISNLIEDNIHKLEFFGQVVIKDDEEIRVLNLDIDSVNTLTIITEQG